MFSLTVRDHVMVAHSLEGETFGPAQRLHGATYVVDATFRCEELDDAGLVVDIALASKALANVLADFGFRNLDDDPALAGVNTTTEVMARVVADRIADRITAGELGSPRLHSLVVTLHESHVAWASYERPLGG